MQTWMRCRKRRSRVDLHRRSRTMRTFLCLAALAAACASGQKPAAEDARARAESIVAAADRTPRDRGLDPGRKPVDMLVFIDARPGMRVAALGAGGGYTTELLARAVAPNGTVYAQNPPDWIEKFLKTS